MNKLRDMNESDIFFLSSSLFVSISMTLSRPPSLHAPSTFLYDYSFPLCLEHLRVRIRNVSSRRRDLNYAYATIVRLRPILCHDIDGELACYLLLERAIFQRCSPKNLVLIHGEWDSR